MAEDLLDKCTCWQKNVYYDPKCPVHSPSGPMKIKKEKPLKKGRHCNAAERLCPRCGRTQLLEGEMCPTDGFVRPVDTVFPRKKK